jgi:predicted acetyltransferase
MAELTFRTPVDDEAEAVFRSDARGFGFHVEQDDIERRRPLMDWSRFRIALDGAEIVGVAGSYALQMTLPGRRSLPAGGVTWISVAPTHRRQGILNRLMTMVHQDIADRGEQVAALSASEAGIYGRFGYGIASRVWVTSIDRTRARFRADVDIEAGSVHFLDDEAAQAHIQAVYERYRLTRPAEVTRTPSWWQALKAERARRFGGASPVWYLAHCDGYAVYRIEERWERGHPAHVLDVVECVSVSPRAHAALWRALLNVDLVGRITSRNIAVDDPLPMLLADPRALRTLDNNDGTWVRPVDIPACLGGRTYGTDDRLVVDIDGTRLLIDGSPAGAAVSKVRSKPDISTDRASLGALVLGGERVIRLAAGGRLTARNAVALQRADRFFLGDVEPHSQTHF